MHECDVMCDVLSTNNGCDIHQRKNVDDSIISEYSNNLEDTDEPVIAILREYVSRDRQRFNTQINLLKAEIVKQKQLIEKLFREKVTTSSFSFTDDEYEEKMTRDIASTNENDTQSSIHKLRSDHLRWHTVGSEKHKKENPITKQISSATNRR